MRRRHFVAGAVGTLAGLGLAPDPSGAAPAPARADTSRVGASRASKAVPRGWRPVPVHGGTAPARLSRISALGPSLAWAVGEEEVARASSGRALAVVWNGETWIKCDLSHLGHTRLSDVAAAGPAAAWSVGARVKGFSPLLRWDGTTWQQIAFPGWDARDVQLNAVAVGPDGRVWACGEREGAVGLLCRARGRWRWLDPLPVAGATLHRVVVSTSGEVWVCGERSEGGGWYGLVARWDGGWTVLPTIPGLRLGLADVHPACADDVWAVGSAAGIGVMAGRPGTPSLNHWDGTAWTQLDPGFGLGALTGIAGDAEGRAAWICGLDYEHPGAGTYLRREGDAWTVVRGPGGAAPELGLNDVTAVPGTDGFWSVGTTGRVFAPAAEAYTERPDG
ncbi:hypothetical protein [Streptomyces sp. NPDC000983]|uniref:hypothetical protein n=1 Tax=Streptomyces sp. NPDC000983 TaxID=3154373 RepID=UPI0033348D98